jgi:dTDP-4-amino-4,6-dideoxygalactose transaminase
VNARLDTLQAAILLEKLRVFADELSARRAVAARYDEGLRDIVQVPRLAADTTSVWAQYTLVIEGGARDGVASALRAKGIPTAVYYPKPLHQQTAYRHFPTAGDALPVAEQLSRQVLSLPMHPYLEPATQAFIIDALRRALVEGRGI